MRILRTTLGATLLATAVLVTAPAHADDPPPAAPASPPEAAAAPAAAAPDAKADAGTISDEARRHFAAGVSLLQDPEGARVEQAYREFKTAYAVSGSAKILGNMGFCAMRLERDGEAVEAYSRYLREVPDIDPDERAQIVRDVQTLSVGVARMTIETDKPGVRIYDVRVPVRGGRVTNTYGPVEGKLEIGVRPGHHVFTAKLEDHDDETWEVDAFAASREKHAFVMTPTAVAPVAPVAAVAPRPVIVSRRGSNVGPWVVMGIGGAMLVGGAVTGLVALGKTSDIEDKCPGDVCPRSFDLDSERSSAKTFVRITDLLLIGGGLVTATGLGWLLLSGDSEKGSPSTAARARVSVPIPTAGCGPDGCRAAMKVVF